MSLALLACEMSAIVYIPIKIPKMSKKTHYAIKYNSGIKMKTLNNRVLVYICYKRFAKSKR